MSSLLHILDYKTRGYDTMMAHVLLISTIWILGPALQSLAQNWINKYKYTNENDLLYFTDSKMVFLFHFYHFWNQNASYNWCCIKDELAVCSLLFFCPLLSQIHTNGVSYNKGRHVCVCVCVSFRLWKNFLHYFSSILVPSVRQCLFFNSHLLLKGICIF